MKKTLKKIVGTSALILTGMYTVNKYIENNVTSITPTKQDKIFTWRDMEIHYLEKGEKNKPSLLLIHNLYPSSSKEEWNYIDEQLALNYHIYELDLPGCGKSDKPNITYINFMYVQLLSSFMKEVIQEKTNICAAAYSSSFALMTARMNENLINKIIIINPTSIDELVKPVSKQSMIKKQLIELPIVGTSLYNYKMKKTSIEDDFKYIYYYNDKNVDEREINISYYNAHCKKSCGKYLLGSILGNYTNINIIHALTKIENDVYLIGSGHHKKIIQEYMKYNKKIQTIFVSNCRLLPHLEIPKTIISEINHILLQ